MYCTTPNRPVIDSLVVAIVAKVAVRPIRLVGPIRVMDVDWLQQTNKSVPRFIVLVVEGTMKGGHGRMDGLTCDAIPIGIVVAANCDLLYSRLSWYTLPSESERCS